MAKKREITYSEAINEIEATLQRFRNEELSVDELTESVKRTSELITLCKTRLKSVEEELKSILEQ
ncbi:MAG: exodeoxyribonuclease VII small subunit [Alistipes sp.]|nr:exodeoxyribonuclease VII small subunit [Alistipes sp.]